MSQEAMEEEDLIEDDRESAPTKRGGFVLTADDITIFKLIYEFRFLRREHVVALTRRHPMSIYRRLAKLQSGRYLTVIRLPLQKHIYGLDKRALPILVEQGIGSPELLSERVRTHELKEFFLKHELMIVELHVILALATREPTSHLRLINWREGRELFDSVSFFDRGARAKLPVRPDAFFTLEDTRRPAGASRRSFFLEADRSTSSQTRFSDKIRAYWQYVEQGLHAKKYKISSVRVLTVALTDERAENLRNLAIATLPEQGGRKYYLFTSLKQFSLDAPLRILDDIYLSAKSSESGIRESLIPPPPPNPS